MSMVLHVEARETFQFELGKFLRKACRRWQMWRDGVTAEDLLRVELKLPTFLKMMNSGNDENIDDQPYKFWWSLEEGVRDGTQAWIRTERRYEEFKRRISRSRWFTDEDVTDITQAWDTYWAIEKEWLISHTELEESRSLLQNSGAIECFHALKKGDAKAAQQEMLNITQRTFISSYRLNKYKNSSRAAFLLMKGAMELCANEPDTGKRFRMAQGIMEMGLAGHLIILNTRAAAGYHLWSSLVGMWFEARRQLGISVQFCWGPAEYTSLQIGDQAVPLSTSPELRCRFLLAELMTQKVAMRTQFQHHREGNIYNAGFLVTIKEFLNACMELATGQGVEQTQRDTIKWANKLREGMGQAQIEVARAVLDAMEYGIEAPESIPLLEWSDMQQGVTVSDAFGRSGCALSIAKAHIQCKWDREKAAEWIVRSADALGGTPHNLAWSDVFSMSHAYFLKRGNSAMAGRAIDWQRKLQREALGKDVDNSGLDRQNEELEERVLHPEGGRRSDNEEKIRQLLLNGPDVLEKKRRRVSGSARGPKGSG